MDVMRWMECLIPKKKKIDELTTFLTTPYKIFDKEVYI